MQVHRILFLTRLCPKFLLSPLDFFWYFDDSSKIPSCLNYEHLRNNQYKNCPDFKKTFRFCNCLWVKNDNVSMKISWVLPFYRFQLYIFHRYVYLFLNLSKNYGKKKLGTDNSSNYNTVNVLLMAVYSSQRLWRNAATEQSSTCNNNNALSILQQTRQLIHQQIYVDLDISSFEF